MRKLLFLIVYIFLVSIYLINPSPTYATWYKYPNNPVLDLGSSNSFDSAYVEAPSVLYKDGIYHMWYAGGTGAIWTIGHATSSDGLSWSNREPIDIDLSADPDVSNIHDPYVLYEDGLYKMWYAVSDSGFSFIHINYATSTDGINWDFVAKDIIPAILYWESENRVSFPSVIHNQDGYKMWFSGSDYDSFRIGYATSTDGLNWTQFPDPVMAATQDWEDLGLGGPHVIYENNIYEMYYHTGYRIGYATSQDGISWTKDSNNPIISPSPEFPFESLRLLNPFVLKSNGINMMWYNGQETNYTERIGYVQSEPFGEPTPTGPNPVVLIPGMGASWNQSDMFACNLSQSNDWTLAPYADSFYRRLIKTFTQNVGLILNQNFYIYGYDWRQNMVDAGAQLKEFLDSIPSDKVNIVSHSLGGLVARSYIQENPNTHKVDKLVTLGTPHAGTVLAYPLWENGEVWTGDLVYKLAINTLINICRVQNGFPLKTRREMVHLLSPSVRDILPTFDFIYKNNLLITDELVEGENPWLRDNSFLSPFNNTSLLTISGNGYSTIETLKVKNAKAKDVLAGNWLDGDPFKRQTTNSGDGTVLSASSLIPGSTTKVFTTDHVGLIKDNNSIQAVLDFLGYSSFSPAVKETVPESQSSLTVTVDKPVEMELLTTKGISLQQTEAGILAEFSDKPNIYKLRLKTNFNGTLRLSVGQTVNAGDSWKDYKIKVKKGEVKNFSIQYNPQKLNQNPLTNL